MAWIAAIGVSVAGFFGTTMAAGGLASMVIGSVVVGAAVGALYSAVTNGNILEGMLYGAVGGAVLGAGGHALGFGAPSLGGGPAALAGGSAGGDVASLAAAEAASAQGSILTAGAPGATQQVAQNTGAKLFTSESWAAIGALSSMGSAFLKKGNQLDPDAQIAEAEKDRQLQYELAAENNAARIETAKLGADATVAVAEARKEVSLAELDESQRQFDTEFEESKWRDRQDRQEKEDTRLRLHAGIDSASQYVQGNTQTASVVQANAQRRNLPGPVWWDSTARQRQRQQQQQQRQQP